MSAPTNCSILDQMRFFASPMMPYFLADAYFGLEPTVDGCEMPVVDSRPLFTPTISQMRCDCWEAANTNATALSRQQLAEAEAAVLQLPPWSKLYVQVNLFALFVARLLPLLRGPTILLSGQWHLPSLTPLGDGRTMFEAVLSSEHVVRWWSQNPVPLPAGIPHAHKYRGLPYGISHLQLASYAECWARAHAQPPNKTKEVYYSPFRSHGARDVSDARARLVSLRQYASRGATNNATNASTHSKRPLAYDVYCSRIAKARFVISPAGDRFECYRHWEAIGLGTVPVCDCPLKYLQIVPGGMLIASSSAELVELVQRPPLIHARFSEQQHEVGGLSMQAAAKAVLVRFWRRRVDADLPKNARPVGVQSHDGPGEHIEWEEPSATC